MLENSLVSSDLKPYETRFYNVVKNTFDNFVEVCYYKESFSVTTGNYGGIDEETGEVFIKGLNCDRSRKFKEENGVLVPIKDSVKIFQVQNTIKNSRKRALDNIFGYALSNDWNYFLTLTFDPNEVDRDNEEEVKNAYSLFRKKLQYRNPAVKILAIPERHPKSGKLHFHCLVGDIDLEKFLNRAYNPKNGKPLFSNGRAVYNLSLFDFGFSTCVKTDSNKLKVANYLTKYITKDFGTLGYNKKSYFATHNLNFKNKEFFMVKETDIQEMNSLINNGLAILYKETDKMVVYRYELPFFE